MKRMPELKRCNIRVVKLLHYCSSTAQTTGEDFSQGGWGGSEFILPPNDIDLLHAAPAPAASFTPAQAQLLVAQAKQAEPAATAGLSAALNSPTALCTIPAGNSSGKILSKWATTSSLVRLSGHEAQHQDNLKLH